MLEWLQLVVHWCSLALYHETTQKKCLDVHVWIAIATVPAPTEFVHKILHEFSMSWSHHICAIVLETEFHSATIAGIENIDLFDFWESDSTKSEHWKYTCHPAR
jgi:hypothetical protein